MCGVAQKASSSPVISGCRTTACRPPTCSAGVVGGRGARPAGLPEPGELEVVDRERRRDRQDPAGRAERPQDDASAPSTCQTVAAERLPQHQQQHEADVGGQDVRRPLERRGDPAAEPRLDRPAGHHRVLGGEQQQEGQVDADRGRVPMRGRSVHGPRDDDVGEERHGPHDDGDEPQPAGSGQEREQRLVGTRLHAAAARCARRSRGTTSLVRLRRDVPGRDLGARPEARGATGSARGATRPTAR